jgi:hypothetical protein
MSIELTNQAREDEAISDHIETLILLAVMDYRRSSVHLTRQSGGERTSRAPGLKALQEHPAGMG